MLLRASDGETPLAGDQTTAMLSAVGLVIVVLGKMTLGRSFGIVPANRGVVVRGPYNFVRHPIYAGYLITHAAFLLAHPAPWNMAIVAVGGRRPDLPRVDGRAGPERRCGVSAVLPARRMAPGSGGVLMNVSVDERTDATAGGHAVEIAATRGTRRRGLLGRDRLDEATAMLLAPCAAVHTVGMRFRDRRRVRRPPGLRGEDRPQPAAVADGARSRRSRGDRDGGGQRRVGTGSSRRSSVPGAGVRG